MGLLASLGLVGCLFTARVLIARPLIIEPSARTPPIAAACLSWAAIRSWVLRSTDTGRALVAPRLSMLHTDPRVIEQEATSLPSPALQRVRAICA